MDFKYQFEPLPFAAQLEAACKRVIRERQIAIEQLTGDQIADALKQAILCGDFQRNVLAGSDQQSVVYLPGRGMDELRAKCDKLEDQLSRIKEILYERIDPS